MTWKRLISALGLILLLALAAGWLLAPRVGDISPQEGPLHGRQSLQISFNKSMDQDSVEGSLSLQPSHKVLYTWDQAARTLTITPQRSWPSNRRLSIRISSQARSQLRLPLINPKTWQIQISPYLLTYLHPADQNSNLYSLNVENGKSEALTDYEDGILDYDLSPDGLTIYYSKSIDEGMTGIYALQRTGPERREILTCGEATCRNPQISPSGEILAYERIPRDPQEKPGVLLLNLTSQETSSVWDAGNHLELPQWSDQGWLAFYDRTEKVYRFLQPSSGERVVFENEIGAEGTWAPDGVTFVTAEFLDDEGDVAPRHLFAYNLVTETKHDLTGERYLEDANPAYAPSGSLLAFARKSLEPEQWTPGRQLWIMEREGEGAYPLTDAVDYHHTAFTWHPDADRLAYVRYNQAQLAQAPEIWLIHLASSQNARLVINAFAPRWIP